MPSKRRSCVRLDGALSWIQVNVSKVDKELASVLIVRVLMRVNNLNLIS
jgi:hypothetical protein